jgi:hypothetical protein
MLERQTVQGRANDGGLRIGEMERDGILAHGASHFLNESFLVRGDEYYMAVCNKTGTIAVYNQALNIFLSPFSDGPIQFTTTLDGKLNVDNVSRFGRSFSLVRIPYSLKLLIHELQVMNVQMRIITEDNVDQLMSMSYSDNINKLMKNENPKISDLVNSVKTDLNKMKRVTTKPIGIKEKVNVPTFEEAEIYKPEEVSLIFEPPYEPISPVEPPPGLETSLAKETLAQDLTQEKIRIQNPELKSQYDALDDRDKLLIQRMIPKMVEEKRQKIANQVLEETVKLQELALVQPENPLDQLDSVTSNDVAAEPKTTSILEIEDKKEESKPEEIVEENSNNSSISGETKKVVFNLAEEKK